MAEQHVQEVLFFLAAFMILVFQIQIQQISVLYQFVIRRFIRIRQAHQRLILLHETARDTDRDEVRSFAHGHGRPAETWFEI